MFLVLKDLVIRFFIFGIVVYFLGSFFCFVYLSDCVVGRGFKRVLLWWLGYFLCLGFVVILFSWVYFESLVGYNKWVRKSLGF